MSYIVKENKKKLDGHCRGKITGVTLFLIICLHCSLFSLDVFCMNVENKIKSLPEDPKCSLLGNSSPTDAATEVENGLKEVDGSPINDATETGSVPGNPEDLLSVALNESVDSQQGSSNKLLKQIDKLGVQQTAPPSKSIEKGNSEQVERQTTELTSNEAAEAPGVHMTGKETELVVKTEQTTKITSDVNAKAPGAYAAEKVTEKIPATKISVITGAEDTSAPNLVNQDVIEMALQALKLLEDLNSAKMKPLEPAAGEELKSVDKENKGWYKILAKQTQRLILPSLSVLWQIFTFFSLLSAISDLYLPMNSAGAALIVSIVCISLYFVNMKVHFGLWVELLLRVGLSLVLGYLITMFSLPNLNFIDNMQKFGSEAGAAVNEGPGNLFYWAVHYRTWKGLIVFKSLVEELIN